jgi:riboflavin kinase, archaea type
MKLFLGTLNVQLNEPYALPIRSEGKKYGGSVSVKIAPCSILGRSAFILRTDANEHGRGHHLRTIIEIATDVKLGDVISRFLSRRYRTDRHGHPNTEAATEDLGEDYGA